MDMKSKSNFKHYFVNSDHNESDFFEFDFNLNNVSFKFKSCDDVFSKNQIDEGSLLLVNTIIKNKENYTGNILDMCCGYGAIGVVLSKFLNATFDMCDINELAVKLCNINANKNSTNFDKIFVSDIWQNVQKKYNHIVSNPPIKTGKNVLLRFINNAKDYLEENGTLTIVIKKNLGADSTKKYLTNIFGNCQVLKRDKGYYILQSTNK